ncbi:hypothetical protein, partial [Leyella stercorea]|uniref:hypothetical protein n=1 Tax=Leyella stercorea TaxID=363265 RepID=UPI00242EB93F
QYGLVIYGLSSIHDAKINNNIGLLKTQQYYLIQKKSYICKRKHLPRGESWKMFIPSSTWRILIL